MKKGKKDSQDEYEKFIGLTKEEATKFWKNIRAVEVDGRPTICTQDFKMDRLNVRIKDGKIISVKGIG